MKQVTSAMVVERAHKILASANAAEKKSDCVSSAD
jgi:hypothetical protein